MIKATLTRKHFKNYLYLIVNFKSVFLSITILFGIQRANSQEIIKHLNPNLIVVADDLNFRSEANTSSNIISKLKRGEHLTLKNVVQSENNHYNLFWGFERHWVKVVRESTGAVGFVYGDFVSNQNAAFFKNQDCSKIQNGNWYGLYHSNGEVFMVRVNPKIETSLDGYNFISSDSTKYQFYICSNTRLREGKIDGTILTKKEKYITVNSKYPLIRIEENQFDLVGTGTVELRNGYLGISDKELIFLKTEIQNGNKKYYEQNLTKSIIGYGEVGYKIEFVGDLNRDGVPELILSEADNRSGTLYYFLSNEKGELELQSLTWSYSKC